MPLTNAEKQKNHRKRVTNKLKKLKTLENALTQISKSEIQDPVFFAMCVLAETS